MDYRLPMITTGLLLLVSFILAKRDETAEKNPQFWKDIAKDELDVAIDTQKLNTNKAKNVIIFLGDGMGIPTVTAGRILKGQMRRESGEETKLAMDKLPHVGLSRTYSVNKQVSDSAATATAYLCGVKSNYYTIGINGAATLGNCQSSKGNEVRSVLEDFYDAGKATGVVTTTRINHATPAATYAHSAHRKWYYDGDLTDEAKENGCKDIAHQFFDQSHKITVSFGGGRQYFRPSNTFDEEYPNKNNKRKDGNDFIEQWKEKMTSLGKTHEYVWNKEQFDMLDVGNTDTVLGLFEPKDLQYEAERNTSAEPSLTELTEKAIEFLKKDEDGFFLLVEGGRIDHAHHGGNAYLALHETVAFDNAIEKAVEITSPEDTMIIVTADHGHTITMGGYADRGNDIFGLAPSKNSPELAADKKPYTTLVYANGPGYTGHHYIAPDSGYDYPNVSMTERRNLTGVDTASSSYLQQTAVPLGSETHGGEDVPILATGPMAHLFHGVHEQMYIAYVMRYVACVGPDKGHCEGGSEVQIVDFLGHKITVEKAERTLAILFAFVIIFAVMLLCVLVVCLRQRGAANQKASGKGGPSEIPLNQA